MDARGELVEQLLARGEIGRLHLRAQIAHAVHHQCADRQRCEHASQLVADAHDRDALRRALDRAEDADVRIRRGLQDRQPGTDDEDADHRAGVHAPVVYWPNTTAPIAIANRPSAMPFFMPAMRRIDEDGSARQK